MNQILLIGGVLLSICTMALIIASIVWIYTFMRYRSLRNAFQRLESAGSIDLLGKVTANSEVAIQKANAVAESLEALNAKLAQRHRREDARARKEEKPILPTEEVDPDQLNFPFMPQAQDAPEGRKKFPSRLKRRQG